MDKRRMRLPFIRAVLIELSCWVSLDSGVGLAMDWTRNLNHDSDHAQPEITQPGRVMARSPPAITTGSAAAPAYPGIHFPTSTAGRLTGSESDSDSESESSESDFKLPRSRPAYRLRQSSSLQLCPGPSGMPVMSPGPSQGHCQVALDQSKILTYSDVTPSSEYRSLVSLEFIHHLEGWDVLHNYFLLYNINIVT